MPAQKRTLFDQ